MKHLSRRHFLRYAGSGLALGLGGSRLLAGDHSVGILPTSGLSVSGTGNPLRIPAEYGGGAIHAAVTEQYIWPDKPSSVWTLGGSYPAPTIRVKKGSTFSAKFVNDLPDHSNIHFHGLIVPPEMDGHPKDVVMPGGTFDYSFAVDQKAGTYWYHPHPHMMTGEQIYHGMAGFFIVEDDAEKSLGLPSGEYDIPLLLQDRRLSADRVLTYEIVTENDHLEGYLGDTVLVNGTPDAYLEVAAGLYRFRILNGSNGRVYDLSFADGHRFHVIGTDGGLIDHPYPVEGALGLYIGPAERVEILVDFSSYAVGQSIVLKSLKFSAATGDTPQQGMEMQVIRFDITRPASAPVVLPESLVSLPVIDPTAARGARTFVLQINHDVTPVTHTINAKEFEMDRIDERVPFGDMEIWTFQNVSFLWHPMHIHGAQFLVLSKSGVIKLEARDLGWKDTVLVKPYQTVKLLVRFAPWKGLFLAHCHNLEHEDHGMMFNYAIVDSPVGVEQQEALPERMELR